MYYSDLVNKAANISYEAHHKQKDKGKYPYFMHPLTLALQLNDEISVCVALLHDVVEDHAKDGYTMEYLANEFPKEVIDALKLLTHDDKIGYLDYIMAIKNNPIARQVKLLDLKHNIDVRRNNDVKPHKYDLYLQAIQILEEN